MVKLTKRELVKSVSQETGTTKETAYQVIQSTLELIMEALVNGRNVELRNFGIFKVSLNKARIGRNPKKPGKKIIIPPKAKIKFEAGKTVKERLSLLHKSIISAKPKENVQTI